MNIPYGKQWIDEEDINEVVKVLRGDWLTQGIDIDNFEKNIAEYVNTKYAVAFSSGTAALHGAMFAAGITQGDEIISSPITFVASTNAGIYQGAKPVFVDIDFNTYCLNINEIENKITENTKAIVPVDYAGYPVNINKIKEIAKKYNLIVIEDAAHALGAKRNEEMVGSQSDMTMFSFHPVKHITTGEGGVIATNNVEYYEKLKMFRTHGITKSNMQKNDGPWYYEMQTLGYNYRMTDIQAVLGSSQLKKLNKFLKRRREIAKRYDEVFKENNLLTVAPTPQKKGWEHAYHLYPLLFDKKINRKEVYTKLRERGIYTQVHYIPVHTQPYYMENYKYKVGNFPKAEEFYSRELSIPMFPKMTDEEVEYVIKNILEIVT